MVAILGSSLFFGGTPLHRGTQLPISFKMDVEAVLNGWRFCSVVGLLLLLLVVFLFYRIEVSVSSAFKPSDSKVLF